MTISKPRQGEYNANYDPRPKNICIGITLVSVETETIIQDGRAITLNVDDMVCYITVLRELSNNWDALALLVEEQEGYRRSHWTIQSVWECVPQHIADDIF
ncbi:MAG: hypothetical protein AAF383_05325 [Cyanobacteria bacterium P01_A01_bin.83]